MSEQEVREIIQQLEEAKVNPYVGFSGIEKSRGGIPISLIDKIIVLLLAQQAREKPEPQKQAFAAFNWERDNDLGDVYTCQECGQRLYGNGHKYCSGCGLPLCYDEDYATEPKGETGK